ncbi:hypothetical protein H9P43_005564 [Blastocladiella emersonii ATCC 22665]|nr:hypothetical protein H9P43_005564 [Blastocladiella emersonii ATCC 22665]
MTLSSASPTSSLAVPTKPPATAQPLHDRDSAIYASSASLSLAGAPRDSYLDDAPLQRQTIPARRLGVAGLAVHRSSSTSSVSSTLSRRSSSGGSGGGMFFAPPPVARTSIYQLRDEAPLIPGYAVLPDGRVADTTSPPPSPPRPASRRLSLLYAPVESPSTSPSPAAAVLSEGVPLDRLPECWQTSLIALAPSATAAEHLHVLLASFVPGDEAARARLFLHPDDETVMYALRIPGRAPATDAAAVSRNGESCPMPRSCCPTTSHRAIPLVSSQPTADNDVPLSALAPVPPPAAEDDNDEDTDRYLLAAFILRSDLHAVCFPHGAPVFLDHRATPASAFPRTSPPPGCTFANRARDLHVWLRVAVQGMKQNGTWGRHAPRGVDVTGKLSSSGTAGGERRAWRNSTAGCCVVM